MNDCLEPGELLYKKGSDFKWPAKVMAMALLPLLNQLWQELQMNTLFNLFLVPLLFFSVFILLSLPRSGGKLKLPPSPTRLPIIGNLHQLGTLAHRSLQALSNKYGPLMLLHIGQVPTLVVSSAEMTKEIMKTHDTVFSSRAQSTAAKMLVYGCQDVGFAPYGEYWRQVRKICVLELLSLRRVQQFQYAREEEAAELIGIIRKASLSESPVNLSKILIGTSNNIMSRCILGQKFEEENGNSRFGELSRRLMMQLVAFCVGDFFPYLRWVDSLRGLIAGLKATAAELDGFFNHLIEEHKTSKRDGDKPKDFVDILLQLGNDGMPEFELTSDNLKAILTDMFVGGSDTTSTGLEWLMTELVRNPSVMDKVQEEVRRVVGKKAKVDVNDLNQMGSMKCVIKENLRLHPPVPLLVPRETTAGVELGGYYIPAKTRVFVNAFAIQRDPRYWDRPEEFVPERFERNPIDFNGQDFQFIPFGGGRRGCPGLTFAVASAEYVVANLLYWFDWKLPSGGSELAEALDMTEVSGLTVHKKSPLYLVPIPYSS